MADAGYVHNCIIWSRVPKTYNGYGEVETTTDSSQNTVCRFYYSQKHDPIIELESGEHIVEKPSVMLPPTVTVEEGNTIVTTETGFANSYQVTSAIPVYYLFRNAIHHWECSLEVVR